MKNLWLLVVGVMAPTVLFAETGDLASAMDWAPLAAGIGIAIAVVAAATAQGRVAASYLEGVSRNPGARSAMFVPLILGLAFVETLVLFTILIEMMVLGKV